MADFIPEEALPPIEMASAELRQIAVAVASCAPLDRAYSADDVLPVLRLGAPFGDPTGLALPAQTPVVCIVAEQFARRYSQSLDAHLGLIEVIAAALSSTDVVARCPEIGRAPRPNANILWATHQRLARYPAHRVLAPELQFGLIHLLDRTGWQQHRAAAKTIDATLTAVNRILPALDADELRQVLTASDPAAAGEFVHRAARTLTYLRRPDVPLPPDTVLLYVRDFCEVVNHPEWSAALRRDGPIGISTGAACERNRSARQPPAPVQAEAEPTAWFEPAHFDAAVRQTADGLSEPTPDGHEATDAPERGARTVSSDDLAVMREYRHPLAWRSAHPNDIAALHGMICRGVVQNGRWNLRRLTDDRLAVRSLLLGLCWIGQSSEWLSQIVIADRAPDLAALKRPHYVVPLDAIVHVAPFADALPEKPVRAPELYGPVSGPWLIPLPELLAPWWRELARRLPVGSTLLKVDAAALEAALRDTTTRLRRATPNLPALTEGRLRQGCTAMLERAGQLDPLMAAYVTGQWRTPLRVPAHYATISAERLAGGYRDAVGRAWLQLRAIEPRLPDIPRVPLAGLPALNMGSPYLPTDDAVRTIVEAAQAASASAATAEAQHNALVVRLLVGLDIFLGLRIGEVDQLSVLQIDLTATWRGQPWPHLVVPEAKANWWTTAARSIPIPKPLLKIAAAALAGSEGQASLCFLSEGGAVPVTADTIADYFDRLGVARPRWHDGRHWLRHQLLVRGLSFSSTNCILGHESQGSESLNPCTPLDIWTAWQEYAGAIDAIAAAIGWRAEP